MKTIYFVRHAKSSWSNPELRDHDRPLNKRGLRDAPDMAGRLVELGVRPDGILTSSAKRAQQTAGYFASALTLDPDKVIVDEALYHAYPAGIAECVRRLPADWDTVLLFGHNPGYTDLANALEHDDYLDNVPTCGIIIAEADVDNWRDFSVGSARRTGFLYPKERT